MQTQTIARATAEITRTHPDARDASVSTRGHEPLIRQYWKDGATPDQIAEWLRIHAPEIDPEGTRMHPNTPDQFTEFYFLPTARDARGYFTSAYVMLYFAEYDAIQAALTAPAAPEPPRHTYQTLRDNHIDRWDTPEYRAGWYAAANAAASSDGPRDKATAETIAVECLTRANAATDRAAEYRALGEAARYFTL